MIRVVLVDIGSRRTATLCAVLADAGMELIGPYQADTALPGEIEFAQPDVVLVAADGARRDDREQLLSLRGIKPKPVLILASDDRQVQTAAAAADLNVYVAEGLSPALLRTLLAGALRQSRRETKLEKDLDSARQALEERRVVDRARCILMEREHLGEQEAYRQLQSHAMQRGLKLAELARRIIVDSAQQLS